MVIVPVESPHHICPLYEHKERRRTFWVMGKVWITVYGRVYEKIKTFLCGFAGKF